MGRGEWEVELPQAAFSNFLAHFLELQSVQGLPEAVTQGLNALLFLVKCR